MLGSLPALITARWCPFTVPADNFWRTAARRAGVTLRILDAESEEGSQVMVAAGVAGVPCALISPEQKRYGMELTPAEAEAFLRNTT